MVIFTQYLLAHRWLSQPAVCRFIKYILPVVIVFHSANAFALFIYQSPEDFIDSAFEHPPDAKTVWISGELKKQLDSLLGRSYHKLRLRYWTKHRRSAWVLDEIGKEHYITAGFVVENNTITKTSILIFRETRGWEIKYDFFTRQFNNIGLTEKLTLNKQIDNITGATLSVDAVKKMAKTALFLHRWINKDNDTP